MLHSFLFVFSGDHNDITAVCACAFRCPTRRGSWTPSTTRSPTEMDIVNLSIGGPDYLDEPFVDKARCSFPAAG